MMMSRIKIVILFLTALFFTAGITASAADVIVSGKYFRVFNDGRLETDEGDLPGNYTIEDIPNYSQDKKWCAPTSLSMVLEYWRKRMDHAPFGKDEIRPITLGKRIDPEADGMKIYEIVRFADSLGLYARSYGKTSLRRLKALIASGYPVIIIRETQPRANKSHALLLVGYSDRFEDVELHDPAAGIYSRSYKQFKRALINSILICPKN